MPDARRFVNYPTNRLLGVFDDAGAADAAIGELVGAGIVPEAVERFAGLDDAGRLGGLGASGRRWGRLLRSVQFLTMDQMPDFLLYEEAVREGRTVVAIRAPREADRRAAIAALRRHGGHFLNFYGRLATEEISLWRGPEPPIPGFLRR